MKSIISIYILLSLPYLLYGQTHTSHFPSKDTTISIPIINYSYLLFEPINQEAVKNGLFPLLIFLHGSGERGEDIEMVKKHGPPKIVEQNPQFPFYLLSPQCPNEKRWDPISLKILIDKIVKKYPIDTLRIYLTGLSMGGFGTWDLAIKYPNKFAAIAPVCGGGLMHKFSAYKTAHIPTWIFHGALDNIVPVTLSIDIVKALKGINKTLKFTLYPMMEHDSWTATYSNKELYDWFLQYSK